MPNFRYIAINRDNKKVAGQITAETEDLARKELHRLGFSVLTMGLQEETQKQTVAGVKNFEFEGVDKTGKVVKGTIEGTAELPVYRRLIEEYGFKISYLADEYATPEEKATMRKQGLYDLQNMYLQSKQEMASESRSFGQKIKDYFAKWTGEEDEEKRIALEKMRRAEFLKQIDKATERVSQFAKENSGKLVGQIQHDLQTALDHVVRIRNSNNEKNIKIAAENMLAILVKAKQALDLPMQAGEDKIDYHVISINSNPEMQHSDETEAEYILRLRNVLRQKDTHELLTGILKDFAMLVYAPQRKMTWKRIGMKWHEYLVQHKAEREAELAERQKTETEKGAVQTRRSYAEFAWIWNEIHSFAGLLLFFYVIYFVIAGILASKNLGINPELFRRTLESDLLRQMLLLTFMLYVFGEFYNLYLSLRQDKIRIGYWCAFTVLLVFFSVNL